MKKLFYAIWKYSVFLRWMVWDGETLENCRADWTLRMMDKKTREYQKKNNLPVRGLGFPVK